MDFRILGPLEVWDGERQLELGGPKRRAVLALLLLHANEVVGVDRLVDQLWGEKAPRNATAALHTHVSRLRKELGPEIVARRAWGYVLRTEPGALDLERFERLVADAESLPARERAEQLREALALWRGSPLQDVAFEPALARDVARLDELRLTVLENRIDADLEVGTRAGVVGELEALIAEHPLRERLRGQLILALYRSGRQAEALEVYRETRRVLSEELGLDPSPELRELERAILQHDPALQASPTGGAVVAEPGVRPGRRRRIFIGASLALLLAGLGGATAYALSAHTTRAADAPTTSAPTGRTNTAPTTAKSTNHDSATTSQGNHRHGNGTGKSTGPGGRGSTVSTARTQSTTTVTGQSRPPPPPKPVTISDAFADDYVHPMTWGEVTDGGDVSIVEQGGQLQLTVGASASPGGRFNQIDVHVGTQCAFPKSFDARVDYTLLEWPANDNIDIGMNAIYAAGAVMRDSSSQSGDGYASWAGSDTSFVPIPDLSGRLRIARVKGIETTYFWHEGQWQSSASSRETGPAVIGLQAFSDGHDPFGGQELKVAFDNFTVAGIQPSCPPGAGPRS
ncbi:MAG TPA: BTAD domain-containing putative transcriptional regulator [Gaiellaceae bacterium]|nr:BTAD domain-containing putative transcriptional regulator [Gaiellaceae bacterium]